MKAMVPKGPSMNEMLRQAQKMQEDMQNKQAELEEREYDVSAGGGVVKVKINLSHFFWIRKWENSICSLFVSFSHRYILHTNFREKNNIQNLQCMCDSVSLQNY